MFCSRVQVGVTKLNETNAMVEGLKGDLTKLEPILEQASKDAEKLLKQVEIDKADAAKVKEKVRAVYDSCCRVEQQYTRAAAFRG